MLRRRSFFEGRRIRGSNVRDIMWLLPTGREISDAAWAAEHVKCLGVRLAGGGMGERDEEGRPIVGETLVYVLNADATEIDFTLPAFEPGLIRRCLIDTFDEHRETKTFVGGETCQVGDRSAALFQGASDRHPSLEGTS